MDSRPLPAFSRVPLGATLLVATGLGAIAGCVRPELPPRPRAPEPVAKDYYRALPPGAHALRRITDPAQLPDLRAGLRDRAELAAAVERSRSYLSKPSARAFFPVSGISHEQVVRSLDVVAELLASPRDDAELAAELHARFDVYTSVGCDDRGTVLFTGYYTPIFAASRERTERFRYPLHRPPEGHVKDPVSGKTLGLRRPDGGVDPAYPDRAGLLASGLLDGRELVWLSDAFEAYVIGVQGSAFLRLPDGSPLEVGYAGNNGHPYASLGQKLVDSGRLRREQLNLRALIAYFRAHPEEFAPMAAHNARYVYFQESSGGPYGCLNERVTRLRSIATDKSIFPRGALCFLQTELPVPEAGPGGVYAGFALDQDAGGAIRAPGRCDVYMGVGEEAGEVAGHTLAEGRLYYLILKDEELYARR